MTKTALITGATSPIGEATARAMAADGWQLLLHSFSQGAKAKDLAAELQQADRTCWSITFDLAQHEQVQGQLKEWQKDHEDAPLTSLVACAGTNLDAMMMRTPVAKIAPVIDINLLAVYNCTQVLLRTMVKQRFGRIIYIGSTAGVAGNAGQAAYAMTKAGLEGLCKSVAREYAERNITCNVVAPGWIETPMSKKVLAKHGPEILASVPAGRTGAPEEVAATVRFFASNDAAYITGQTLMINGGLYMK